MLNSCVDTLWLTSRAHIPNTPLHRSTERKLWPQSVKWLKNHSSKVSAQPGDVVTALSPTQPSISWQKEWFRNQVVDQHLGKSPCALTAEPHWLHQRPPCKGFSKLPLHKQYWYLCMVQLTPPFYPSGLYGTSHGIFDIPGQPGAWRHAKEVWHRPRSWLESGILLE